MFFQKCLTVLNVLPSLYLFTEIPDTKQCKPHFAIFVSVWKVHVVYNCKKVFEEIKDVCHN